MIDDSRRHLTIAVEELLDTANRRGDRLARSRLPAPRRTLPRSRRPRGVRDRARRLGLRRRHPHRAPLADRPTDPRPMTVAPTPSRHVFNVVPRRIPLALTALDAAADGTLVDLSALDAAGRSRIHSRRARRAAGVELICKHCRASAYPRRTPRSRQAWFVTPLDRVRCGHSLTSPWPRRPHPLLVLRARARRGEPQ